MISNQIKQQSPILKAFFASGIGDFLQSSDPKISELPSPMEILKFLRQPGVSEIFTPIIKEFLRIFETMEEEVKDIKKSRDEFSTLYNTLNLQEIAQREMENTFGQKHNYCQNINPGKLYFDFKKEYFIQNPVPKYIAN